MICESRADASGRKVKVLYVITRAEHGGAQVHVRDLFAGLKSEVEPVIATGEDGFLCDEARNAGVRVHRMKHLVRPIRPWTDLRAIAELSAIIRDEKPDLVHTHTSKAGIVGRAAAAITGTPRVSRRHRVRDNLLGNGAFCPTIRRTQALRDFVAHGATSSDAAGAALVRAEL